ncbi:MAG TPA: hypothetical protein VFP53_00545 [Sphingomicrobium sp.]|nr:hypothetical protein [Sphingomicrobium sp.]
MSETPKEAQARKARLRWVTLGEAIAIAALLVSGLGLWNELSKEDKPAPAATTVVEKKAAIPLTLRGKRVDEGDALEIAPVESGHALESLTLTIRGETPIEIGSDGVLDADSVDRLLRDRDEAKGDHKVPVRIETRYVEAGTDKKATGSYSLKYRWEGGGLFGGRSLKLVGLSR